MDDYFDEGTKKRAREREKSFPFLWPKCLDFLCLLRRWGKTIGGEKGERCIEGKKVFQLLGLVKPIFSTAEQIQ